MSKKPAAPLPPTRAARYLRFLESVSATAPCGADLEYHPDLMVVQTRVMPQEAAQYGEFVAPREAVNWHEIETLVLALLEQGRDIRALVLLLRCRIQIAGAEGACQGLWLLAELLARYPDDIHPRRCVDGETDPVLQANALALLADVVEDMREIVVDDGTATRLTLRDIERAQAIPRAGDARDMESIRIQLAALHAGGRPELRALIECRIEIARIEAWARRMLMADAPDLARLTRLFQVFACFAAPDAGDGGEAPSGTDAPAMQATTADDAPGADTRAAEPAAPQASAAPPQMAKAPPDECAVATGGLPGAIASRGEALAHVRAARQWFESMEPSSPVADLLRQAERLTGRRYADIADAIPRDLLARWREDD
ncbi:type VI secretion system protein TssA [Thauera sinica]|uniref:ImpA family type VI secretion system protein n=1 Tax=Thauera sinica TaxID=2665146 RepID=A0ABW1ATM8_9RHOO|nr:type VI secretion system ImpA family N-terminal domain-containing protein [Thauera sp. K11]ATE59942.1 type VI secretion system protein TssA [Thauera sp. K11]